MRTAHVTFMIPQLVQQWQADAAQGSEAAPATETQTQQPAVEEDAFASTFAELANDTPPPTIEKPAAVVPGVVEGGLPAVGADGRPVEPPAPAAAAAAPATVQLTAEQAAANEAAAKAAQPSPTAPNAGDPPPAAQPQPNNEIVEALRSIMAERPASQQAAPATQQAPEITPFTAEEQTLVENYRKEFPEMAAAEELIRRQEHQAVVNYIFSQIGPHLRAIQMQSQSTAQMSHTQQLMAAVPDYAQIHKPVVEWIGKQPDFIKEAYEKVASTGTVPQVMALIDRWRSETKTPAAPAAPAAKAPKTPVVPPAGLLPVQSSRSGVPLGGINKDDFEAAFTEFANSEAA